MPFAMTHLIISYNLIKILPDMISDLPQFYLGSIAPDAVHNRANFILKFMKQSQLFVGEAKWGFITNNDECINNVIKFLKDNSTSDNYDFILSYCTHILTDVYNNIQIWTSFRLKHPDELGKEYGIIHHRENNKIDIEFALTYGHRDELWRYLSESRSVDIPDIIYADEIEKQKDNILND